MAATRYRRGIMKDQTDKMNAGIKNGYQEEQRGERATGEAKK